MLILNKITTFIKAILTINWIKKAKKTMKFL